MERKYPPFETVERIKKWCDLQERSQFDVSVKLRSWGLDDDEAGSIIAELIGDNYLNEERFARAFVRGKSRIKKWGWQKIQTELYRKRVPKSIISLAREEIDDDEMQEVLKLLLERKTSLIRAKSPQDKRNKLIRFALGKGYSFDEINKALN